MKTSIKNLFEKIIERSTTNTISTATIFLTFAAPIHAHGEAYTLVPECYPIHSPSCISWKKVDSKHWSLRNNCGANVHVTLDKESSTPILPPGQAWQSDVKPLHYIVIDSKGWGQFFNELKKTQPVIFGEKKAALAMK